MNKILFFIFINCVNLAHGQILKLVLSECTSQTKFIGDEWSEWYPSQKVDLLALINTKTNTIKIIGHKENIFKIIKYYPEKVYKNGETGLREDCLSSDGEATVIEYRTIPSKEYELLHIKEPEIYRIYKVTKSEYLKED